RGKTAVGRPRPFHENAHLHRGQIEKTAQLCPLARLQSLSTFAVLLEPPSAPRLSPPRLRHGPARLPLLPPLPPPVPAAAVPHPAPPRVPRRARRTRESAFRGRCCFEEVQIIQEQCETGLENRECSHSRCLCWSCFVLKRAVGLNTVVFFILANCT
uniref:Uncharacterized protein n=1 Tax=Triticum urartu TaxID=4572 RepID=A0A8R7QFK2_TRIUA